MVVNAATTDIKDLDCRARISSPIVEMSFAPNGRFLACFTESNMLTVISTTFETKVLDFDTSEGSSQPPLEMKWCGEDRYVGKDSQVVFFLYLIVQYIYDCSIKFSQRCFALEKSRCTHGRSLRRLVEVSL